MDRLSRIEWPATHFAHSPRGDGVRRTWRWVLVVAIAAGVLAWFVLRAQRDAKTVRRSHAPSNDRASDSTAPAPPALRSLANTTTSVSSAGTPANSGAPNQNSGSTPSIIQKIRRVLIADPKRAEELARQDRERFPDSLDADERDALLVAAIYNQHQPLRARLEARHYLRRHPHGRYAEQLMEVTGAHMPVPIAPPPPVSP